MKWPGRFCHVRRAVWSLQNCSGLLAAMQTARVTWQKRPGRQRLKNARLTGLLLHIFFFISLIKFIKLQDLTYR